MCTVFQTFWEKSDIFQTFVTFTILDDWLRKCSKDLYMNRDMSFQQYSMCDQQSSDQPAHTRSLIRAFASRSNTL